MSPCIYRVFYLQGNDSSSTQHYFYHFISASIMLTFYASHFPEILFPGYFDVYFHSHQIFHVFTCLSTYFKFAGLQQDISLGYSQNSMTNSFEVLVSLCIFNAVITIYYMRKMYLLHHPRGQRQGIAASIGENSKKNG